jgi:transposase
MTLTVTHAYPFALDPTPRQVAALLAHAGAARTAYNWGLAQIKANLGRREAERSYGVAEGELTPSFTVHHRTANLRRDGIHTLTTGLAREYGTVVVEDPDVAGMVKNRKLARVVADA